jgi:exopolysaccharide production protein ExoQ
VFVAAKVSAFVALALLGGVGTVYAPALTFTAVAAIFALGLWSFTGARLPSFTRPKIRGSAGKTSAPRSTLTTKLVSGFLLVWWLALLAEIAASSPRISTSSDVAQAAAQGSLRNQVLIVSFGLVGSLFLPAAVKRFDPAFRWVAALWALYLCWAFLSLVWSVYPLLTLRNVVAFVLVTVGSFGLGAGFYGSRPNGRDLFLRHILIAGVLSALTILVPLPFRWGQYDLLDPSFQLLIEGDTATYATRPVMCALLVLVATAILRVRRWQRRDWLWVAVLVLPLLVLKPRGPVCFAALTLAIFYLSYKTRVQDRVVQAGLLLLIGLGIYAYYPTGVWAPLVSYLTLGDVEAATTLTGRTPLWDVLLPEVGQHPWLGVGFAAFFNPENLYWVEQLVGFPAVSAHNGFLEELLNTGVVGLAILLAFCIHVMAVARRRIRQGDPFGWLAVLFLIFYLLLNLSSSLIQDNFQVPFVILLAILAIMASKPMADPQTLQRAPDAAREHFVSTRRKLSPSRTSAADILE